MTLGVLVGSGRNTVLAIGTGTCIFGVGELRSCDVVTGTASRIVSWLIPSSARPINSRMTLKTKRYFSILENLLVNDGTYFFFNFFPKNIIFLLLLPLHTGFCRMTATKSCQNVFAQEIWLMCSLLLCMVRAAGELSSFGMTSESRENISLLFKYANFDAIHVHVQDSSIF